MKEHRDVDAFLACEERWKSEILALRDVLLGCDLDETIKWGKPCYTHDRANVVLLQPMKDFLAVMFFKGALLDDPKGVLEEQGENTRSAKRVCVTSVAQVRKLGATLRALVREALAAEADGRRIPAAPRLALVDELRARLDAEPELRAAFDALTPGRQREYDLFVRGAKQSKTRAARVEKHVARIRAGKGMRDR